MLFDVFLRTLGDTADTSSMPAVASAAQASNDANRGGFTFEEIKEFCTTSSIAMKHTTTVTPQRKRVSARYGQNHATRTEYTPSGGNNAPEEATVTETERQHAQIPNTPGKAIVTDTERFCALVQVMLHYYKNNLLEEDKSSTTAGASSTGAGASTSEQEEPSSPEIGESPSRTGALPQDVGVSSTGITPAITPRTHVLLQLRPHRMYRITRPLVQDPIQESRIPSTTRTQQEHRGQPHQPRVCVNFTCTERNPFRISEGENRVIKIPNDILRCHLLHRSASSGITGTGITGAGISKASSHGIFGATSSRSPSHIGETACRITGSTLSRITGASAGPKTLHGTIGVAGSSSSGTTGPSAEPRVDGSIMSATPGITPATFEPSLGAKLNNETHRQEEVHTLMRAKGSHGQDPRLDLRNQHRTIKRHWRYLRPSCTPASQPQASYTF